MARQFGRTATPIRFASSDAKKLKKTLVYEENVKLGGVMVSIFAFMTCFGVPMKHGITD